MARRGLRLRDLVQYGCILLQTTSAIPEIAFPFNAQVPTVARVGQDYSFQFSSSTFSGDSSNLTYSLSSQSSWLSLDGATRTLSGVPTQQNVGATTFTLTAADTTGAAQMPCTLVVSSDPAPQIGGDISKELSRTANLSSADPPVVTLLPSTPIDFQFAQSSFIDIVKRKLYYYATLTNHTPLPSWLLFDSQTLTFSGTVPDLSAFPQSWGIELIVSDVAGFAGASVSFTIAIATEQLVFVPAQQTVTVKPGSAVNLTDLQNSLFRNGQTLLAGEIEIAEATVPPWLTFDAKTLAISGTAPANVQDANATVVVRDKLGDRATALILFTTANSSASSSIGILVAHSGQTFDYHLPDGLFDAQDEQLVLTLPPSASWLHFDADARELSGKVPVQTTSSSIHATLAARAAPAASTQPQAQTFVIDIMPFASSTITQSSSATSTHAGAGHATNHTAARNHLSSGIVAAVILGLLLAAALLAACLYLIRRRKKRRDEADPDSPEKRAISRPLPSTDAGGIIVATEIHRDVEKIGDGGDGGGGEETAGDPPPQIALDLPSNDRSRGFKWSKRFSRISQVSSLGQGEDAIRADSNIPVWGRGSAALHNTPHDSFSVPMEIARRSKQPAEQQPSPTKRALRRFRGKRRQATTQSLGLGINTGPADFLPRHSSLHARNHLRGASSSRASGLDDGSSMASLSTRGTSVLSTRPSDFPRPPTRTRYDGISRSGQPSIDAMNRKSIRLVERSDSTTDERSMEEKRRSYIRNRASTTFASPLFAHRPISWTSRPKSRGSTAMLQRSMRGNSTALTTCSESSSVGEPAIRGERKRMSQRFRAAFPPNFPRAVTESTIGAADDQSGPVGRRNVGDTSSFYTTDEEISDDDFLAEMAKPRHERTWVVPGEASPTPPPCPPTSRQASSSTRQSTPPSAAIIHRQRIVRPKWKDSNVATSAIQGGKAPLARRSRLTGPMSLLSNDSLNRATSKKTAEGEQKQKKGAPRLVQASLQKRRISVERPQRWSSFQAETMEGAQTRPGSEMFEALEEAGLMMPPPPLTPSGSGGVGSQKSGYSGPAFL
ncbi:hypothetical protein BDY17DRAFT_329829 [Neohortaea acidophila]|uniref:Dystroglycan-type cadherin-like domain-containing protein n=1 Tax=Neohortaea acidophila TaxID=245834 RepID=A0A6A6PIQ4_9PEZI|nr:uncharacterized protein BDY17DRAFT_329829 [Neohortaea acidophila]KAF2479872.1 hypothetical protein BDY17DRAFT_329829 [Neohortaea acidophila]